MYIFKSIRKSQNVILLPLQSMPDESQLSAGILENFRDCLELREKYIKASLQRPEDDPKNLIQDHDVHISWGGL